MSYIPVNAVIQFAEPPLKEGVYRVNTFTTPLNEINYIENEIFKVEVEPQNIRVKNKVTGYENINAFHFEDDEDAGDSYDFSPA